VTKQSRNNRIISNWIASHTFTMTLRGNDKVKRMCYFLKIRMMSIIRVSMSFIRYTLWLFIEIVKSSIGVTKLIWQRPLSITPTTSWIPTTQESDAARVIFANSITLTPGTITICLEDNRLFVHSLTREGVEDLQNGYMDSKIRKAIC
jgi:multisubunit Na+/H+ antiporter MnhE subunit